MAGQNQNQRYPSNLSILHIKQPNMLNSPVSWSFIVGQGLLKHVSEPHCCSGWYLPSLLQTHTSFRDLVSQWEPINIYMMGQAVAERGRTAEGGLDGNEMRVSQWKVEECARPIVWAYNKPTSKRNGSSALLKGPMYQFSGGWGGSRNTFIPRQQQPMTKLRT